MSIVSVTRTPSEQFAPPAESNQTNKKSGWNGMELQLVIDKIYQSWDARSTITFHLGGRRLYTGKWIWIGESSQDGAFVMSSDLRHHCQANVKRYSTSSSDRNFILKIGGGRFVICLHGLSFLLLSDPRCCVECWLSEKYTIVSRYHLCNILSWFDLAKKSNASSLLL